MTAIKANAETVVTRISGIFGIRSTKINARGDRKRNWTINAIISLKTTIKKSSANKKSFNLLFDKPQI